MKGIIADMKFGGETLKLYAVTDRAWTGDMTIFEQVECALKGGVTCVQLREKYLCGEDFLEEAVRMKEICSAYGVPLIINDDISVALRSGADGIHVGGMDAPVKKVRAAVGPDKIVGASCYGDLNLARSATHDGATYVAFGGFYPSRVKKYPVTTPLDIVSEWKKEQPDMPVCVIGGMDVEKGAPLVAKGAEMVAVVSGVYFQDDPEAAAREFVKLFK